MLEIQSLKQLFQLVGKMRLANNNIAIDANIDLAKISTTQRTVTADDTATGADSLLLIDTTAGNIAETLPPAVNKQQILIIKKTVAGNTITLTPDSTLPDTIEGAASLAITGLNDVVILISDGISNWELILKVSGGIAGIGDVVGPSSAVDNHIAIFDSTTGKLIKDSVSATLTDSGGVVNLSSGAGKSIRVNDASYTGFNTTGFPYEDPSNGIIFSVNANTKAAFYPTGMDVFSNPIKNVQDPTNPQDAATKNYVDGKSTPYAITALTGDVTATGPGSVAATIASNAVSVSKMAQANAYTIMGNFTASSANLANNTLTTFNSMLQTLYGIYTDVTNSIFNIGSPRTTTASLNVETNAYNKVGQSIRAHTTAGSAVTPATGGNIVHAGGYYIHTFLSDGDFVIPAGGPTSIDYLIVPGGGSGGNNAGGGGGGAAKEFIGKSVSPGTFPAVIGLGGAARIGSYGPGFPGGDSIFNSDSVTGGGRGGCNANGGPGNGGSGGGSGIDGVSGGTGIPGEGHDGGIGGLGTYFLGGGGGGANEDGADRNDSTGYAGKGGDGKQSAITGNYYGGGGGGGGYQTNGSNPGAGGNGGGGGGGYAGAGVDGTDGLGGGGGGAAAGQPNTSGKGGKGVVIVRYPDSTGNLAQTADLLDTLDDSGNKLSSIDASGNITTQAAGVGFKIKEGSNARMGVATLVGGTEVISNTSVTANTRILLTIQSLGTVATPKAIGVTARTPGTDFTITSADATDTSVIMWELKEPA